MIAHFLITLVLFAVIFSILWFLIGKKLLRKMSEELESREEGDLTAKISKLEEEKQKLAAIRSEIAITSELAKIEKEHERLNEQLRLLEIKKKVQTQKKRSV